LYSTAGAPPEAPFGRAKYPGTRSTPFRSSTTFSSM